MAIIVDQDWLRVLASMAATDPEVVSSACSNSRVSIADIAYIGICRRGDATRPWTLLGLAKDRRVVFVQAQRGQVRVLVSATSTALVGALISDGSLWCVGAADKVLDTLRMYRHLINVQRLLW